MATLIQEYLEANDNSHGELSLSTERVMSFSAQLTLSVVTLRATVTQAIARAMDLWTNIGPVRRNRHGRQHPKNTTKICTIQIKLS